MTRHVQNALRCPRQSTDVRCDAYAICSIEERDIPGPIDVDGAAAQAEE